MASWKLFSGRRWITGLGLLGVWLGASEWLIPAVIRDAYAGESFAFLNAVVTGQDVHAVEHYLGVWRAAARRLTLILVVVVAGVALWPRFGARVAALVWPRSASPPTPGFLLLSAACFGMVAGLLEGSHVAVRHLIDPHPAEAFAWDLVFLAPISATLTFAVVAGFILGSWWIVRHMRTDVPPVPLRTWTFLFGFLAFYSVLESPRLRLAPIGVVVLSLGLAVQLARMAIRSAERFRRVVRRGALALSAPVMLAGALAVAQVPTVREAFALARLPSPASGVPNILLIILDTVRAANLALYGYGRATTPQLSHWADSGVVFERALSTAPWTLPAHASLFTGRYHHNLSAEFNRPLDDAYPTLAEVLRAEGYATAGFVGNLWYTTRASGLARGFTRYEDFPADISRFVSSSALLRRLGRWLLDPRYTREYPVKWATEITESFLDWQTGTADRPFFAFLNYMDAHDPYRTRPPFDALFPDARRVGRTRSKRKDVTPAAMEGPIADYDRAIAYLDNEIGRLLTVLDERKLLDHTLVIIASDHGEQFGEHGLQLHSNSLYMPVIHVPLVMIHRERIPAGRRVAEPISLRDIPATVLDLIGVENDVFPGASLSRHWSGGSSDRTSPIIAEGNCCPAETMPWEPVAAGPMKAVFRGRYHYIRTFDGAEELYDFETDPSEALNLVGDPAHAEALEEMRQVLDSLLTRKVGKP